MHRFPLLLPLYLLFMSSVCFAQSDAYTALEAAQSTINKAYYSQNPELLIQTISNLGSLEAEDSTKKYVHYYLGLAHFRMFPLPMTEDSDLFSDHLDKAQKELEKAIKIDPQFAEAYAILGGVYGMKAAGMFSGMKYGGKAKRAMAKARELQPESPRTYLIDGIGDYYKPKLFGGGLKNALEAFEKAVELFKDYDSPKHLNPDWGEAEAHAWLGQVYLDIGNKKLAQDHIQKAAELCPDFVWVNSQLLPEIED